MAPPPLRCIELLISAAAVAVGGSNCHNWRRANRVAARVRLKSIAPRRRSRAARYANSLGGVAAPPGSVYATSGPLARRTTGANSRARNSTDSDKRRAPRVNSLAISMHYTDLPATKWTRIVVTECQSVSQFAQSLCSAIVERRRYDSYIQLTARLRLVARTASQPSERRARPTSLRARTLACDGDGDRDSVSDSDSDSDGANSGDDCKVVLLTARRLFLRRPTLRRTLLSVARSAARHANARDGTALSSATTTASATACAAASASSIASSGRCRHDERCSGRRRRQTADSTQQTTDNTPRRPLQSVPAGCALKCASGSWI